MAGEVEMRRSAEGMEAGERKVRRTARSGHHEKEMMRQRTE